MMIIMMEMIMNGGDEGKLNMNRRQRSETKASCDCSKAIITEGCFEQQLDITHLHRRAHEGALEPVA